MWTHGSWFDVDTFPTPAAQRTELIAHMAEVNAKIMVSTTSADQSVNSATMLTYYQGLERKLEALNTSIGDQITANQAAQRSRFVRAVPR